jgi:hypothetical protein
MRPDGTRMNAGVTTLFAMPEVGRRAPFMLVLVGGSGVLYRVIETVW